MFGMFFESFPCVAYVTLFFIMLDISWLWHLVTVHVSFLGHIELHIPCSALVL